MQKVHNVSSMLTKLLIRRGIGSCTRLVVGGTWKSSMVFQWLFACKRDGNLAKVTIELFSDLTRAAAGIDCKTKEPRVFLDKVYCRRRPLYR